MIIGRKYSLGYKMHKVCSRPGLAPNDIIQFIYPFKGNQKAIGLDYRTIPSQWSSIVKAKEIKDIFIAGPFDLVQGGRGLIARIPIFTDPPLNEKYWGSVA
ncbi:hypothetical protein VAE308_1150375 [Vibrio aestuarianus]|uniref:CHASE domain-containing protein n=1 Tax=Vibrio aestuarianus TaxID=28171 RepID=A0ABM9FIC6_9VIBR|nr:hypothetical protein VAE063_1000426 [Vibrio aestuarianus]CAH8220047.1 hypothetical protein VAE308_1150375 [Vibrio aestuarianus]